MERHERERSVRETAPAASEPPTTAEPPDGVELRARVHRILADAAAALDRAREQQARRLVEAARRERDTVPDLAAALPAAARAELHTAVAGHARLRRDAGLSPEALLVEVKAVFRDAAPPELDARALRALLEDAVRWGIEGYYGTA